MSTVPLASDNNLYIEDFEPHSLSGAFKQWSQQYPAGGVLALVAESDSENIAALQHQANQNNYPLTGAIFPQLIIKGTLKQHGVLLIHFRQMPAHTITALATDAEKNKGKVNELISALNIDTDTSQSLFMIFDAMVANISSIIDNIYFEIGDTVNYSGANAGSEKFVAIDCIFDKEHTYGNAVLSLLLPSRTKAIIEHGYTGTESSISATSTTGNRISSIDWRPAFEVYKELALKHYNKEITVDNFYENAAHFPFGIMRIDGEMLVRIPVSLQDDGSIFCVGEVPESSILTLLQGISTDSQKAIDNIVNSLTSCDETTMLTFYCAGRCMHLGTDRTQEELFTIHQQADNKDFFGALSLGEIAGSRRAGYPLFHNAAILYIPWN